LHVKKVVGSRWSPLALHEHTLAPWQAPKIRKQRYKMPFRDFTSVTKPSLRLFTSLVHFASGVHFAGRGAFTSQGLVHFADFCPQLAPAAMADAELEVDEDADQMAHALENEGCFPVMAANAALVLYEKVNRRYGWMDPGRARWHGVARVPGVGPFLYLDIEWEEHRRKLEAGKVDKLEDHYDAATAKYCIDGKLVGTLLGSGEFLGTFESYTYFDAVAKSDSLSGPKDLEVGYKVTFGPEYETGTVARILRGSKAAGTAAQSKSQQVFLVLVKAGSKWKYVSLPSIHFRRPFYYGRETWWDGIDEAMLESELSDAFRAKSVSAATKEAAKYALTTKGSRGGAHGAAAGRSGARGGTPGGGACDSARGGTRRGTQGRSGKRKRVESEEEEEEEEEEGGEEEGEWKRRTVTESLWTVT
jgi:hypothetical protein